ncbi:hypothetical protein JOL62DRAFT_606039 [Phyllosticta paracitricarpa]|uniref:Uncharacterized protein n=1 Tax=Phyllosticta paracitricarpa TaxID=2016321 RepID=A0ABR1MYQ6_9PEZI
MTTTSVSAFLGAFLCLVEIPFAFAASQRSNPAPFLKAQSLAPSIKDDTPKQTTQSIKAPQVLLCTKNPAYDTQVRCADKEHSSTLQFMHGEHSSADESKREARVESIAFTFSHSRPSPEKLENPAISHDPSTFFDSPIVLLLLFKSVVISDPRLLKLIKRIVLDGFRDCHRIADDENWEFDEVQLDRVGAIARDFDPTKQLQDDVILSSDVSFERSNVLVKLFVLLLEILDLRTLVFRCGLGCIVLDSLLFKLAFCLDESIVRFSPSLIGAGDLSLGLLKALIRVSE